ncbi:response regulator transcription factor [Saccharomonospora sp. NPDC046836]|uniref:response regulator transcription factor n=1 Tax=Saccharomonospora sp. NPDC046836 TaxID=3156921 RepID=UPI0033C42156
MTTVVLGDGQVLLVEALSVALQQGGVQVVGIGNDLSRIRDSVRAYAPDVCIVDRSLCGDSPQESLRALRAASERTKVIMLTSDAGRQHLVTALASGVDGYIHTSRGYTTLVAAIDKVLGGEVIIDLPHHPTQAQARERDRHVHLRAARLTERERQCLTLLVDGQRTEAIALTLCVSVTTVRTHIQSVLSKLGVHSRLEAAALAVKYALVESPEYLAPDERSCG